MSSSIYLLFLFLAKVLDNALGTAKTILIQRNRCLLAGIALGLSNFIYMYITKDVVTSDSMLTLVIVSIASGVGCCLVMKFDDKFSKDKAYINVIMSDDKEAMKQFRMFLASHKISNEIKDSYTLDWEPTFSITVFAETKEQSKLIDKYLTENDTKFKRMVNGERKR